jgi:hypothetical protein
MPVLDYRISEAVLNRIRRRSATLTEPAASSLRVAKEVKIREAKFSDFESIAALSQRLGQGPDTLRNWDRLWRENPAIQEWGAPDRIGWILAAGEEVVGFLGSIPLLYEYEGKSLIAAATCRFAVDPSYRASGHILMTAFVRQKNVDLLLNTTATPAAGKIMTALKTSQLPQKDFGKVMFWVLDGHHFTEAVLLKAGMGSALSAIGSGLGSMALGVESAFRKRIPHSYRTKYTVVECELESLEGSFDQFCRDMIANTNRLTGRRTAAVMRWHFRPPESTKTAKALLCYAADRLVGYGIVRHEADSNLTLRRSLIADLVAQDDDTTIVQELIAAAYQNAKREGTHVLEMMGFPAAIRQAAARWKPYSREYPSCPFFFKAREKMLHEKLLEESAWYACPFDGDATLWPYCVVSINLITAHK